MPPPIRTLAAWRRAGATTTLCQRVGPPGARPRCPPPRYSTASSRRPRGDPTGWGTTMSPPVYLTGFVATPLEAPTGLVKQAATSSSMQLGWADVATKETGYVLERRLSSATAYTEINKPAANATTYTDGSVATGTTYVYRLRAYRTLNGSTVSPARVYLTVPTPAA